MAYHVDYSGRYARAGKTASSDRRIFNRQHRAGAREWLNVRTVYAPQIVVNGASEHIGSDQRPILRKPRFSAAEPESAQPLMLTAKTEGNQLQVDYEGAGNEKNAKL